MKAKRIIFAAAVAAVAVAIVLLVMTSFAQAKDTPSAFFSFTRSEAAPQLLAEVPVAPLQIPVIFPPGDWPWYAQPEITLHPALPVPGHPTDICAKVISEDPAQAHDVVLEFSVANFGIGVPFVPVGMTPVHVPSGGAATGCVVWIPPAPGHWCIQARLIVPGFGDQISQRNIDIWESLVPGREDVSRFPIGPFPERTTINLEARNVAPRWVVRVDPPSLTLGANQAGEARLIVIPPPGQPLGSQEVVADVEGYVNGVLIGGFRKLDWPPVLLHRPYEPFFAESEIRVFPYPPRAGEPTEICVELYNSSGITRTVQVMFNWANFGIGLPFHPIGPPIVQEIPPFETRHVCITWIPPFGGHFCVQVELNILGQIPYRPQFSQRNLDVTEPLEPGVRHVSEFMVGNFQNEFTNPNPVSTDIRLEAEVLLPGWQVEFVPSVLRQIAPGEARPVKMLVTPPLAPLPPDQTPVADVRALVDGQAGPRVIGGFRKVFRPPIPLHPFPDPPYAEREITVDPYPPRAGEPTEICVELRNPTPYPQDVIVHFAWANFGIGLPFTPINGPRPVHLPPHSIVRECIHWIPPMSGHVCLQIELEIRGYETQRSQRNIDIDEPLEPGMPHSRTFPVGNPFDRPVTINLGLIPHVSADWDTMLSPDVLRDMAPGEVREVTLTVTPPQGQPLPPDGAPIVDIEAYAEGMLIGGFRKIFRPPVPIHRPADPVYAESEITIHPYPPRAREPTELGVEIRNPTDQPQEVLVTFSAASFGIGLPFAPINEPLPVTVPARGMVRPVIIWLPPEEGLWCIQVEIKLPDHDKPFWSQRNIDVGEPLEPKTPHSRPFPVGNPYARPVTITLGLIPHLPDWGLELSQDVLPNMAPGEVREVILTVTPPQDLPGDGDPIVDVEAYVDGKLIGGFRKIFRPPVPIHRPRDPVYAESEIGVDPYPVIPGHPTELSVELFNPTDKDHVVTATFSIAPFGIGLPFSTAHIAPNPILIFVPANGAARGHVMWQPPAWHGKFCVRVTVEMEGHESIWSQRNIDVGEPLEPGVPHRLEFPVGAWPYTTPVTVSLGLVDHMEGWNTSLSDDEVYVRPGKVVSVTLTVKPPVNARLGSGEPIVDVEAYVQGELIGGFRKLDRPPIPLHKPHEKSYAETEVVIDPYPPTQGKPTKIGAVVQNTGSEPVTVMLKFAWAKFGMGIPFTTTGIVPPTRTVSLASGTALTPTVTWTPLLDGPHCIRIELLDTEGEYELQWSQRNVDVVRQPPCGQTQVYTFTVRNDTALTATVDIGTIAFNVPANWEVTVVPSDTLELGPYSEEVVTVYVHIPCASTLQQVVSMQQIALLQQGAGSVPTIDVEGYIDGDLVGGIELRFEVESKLYVYLPVVMRR